MNVPSVPVQHITCQEKHVRNVRRLKPSLTCCDKRVVMSALALAEIPTFHREFSLSRLLPRSYVVPVL